MSNEVKIRSAIREIAGRKKNVTLAEIERLMNQLKEHAVVTSVENDHQRIYSIDGVRFGICTHHPGSKQIKSAYVKEFLRVMSETGWYED
jgi:hypothetical protein